MNRKQRKLKFIREKNQFIKNGFNYGLKYGSYMSVNQDVISESIINIFKSSSFEQIERKFLNDLKRFKIESINYEYKDLDFQLAHSSDDFVIDSITILRTGKFYLRPYGSS
jgi:retron-type reverse transcriptase